LKNLTLNLRSRRLEPAPVCVWAHQALLSTKFLV
jgi:hypothetical protein